MQWWWGVLTSGLRSPPCSGSHSGSAWALLTWYRKEAFASTSPKTNATVPETTGNLGSRHLPQRGRGLPIPPPQTGPPEPPAPCAKTNASAGKSGSFDPHNPGRLRDGRQLQVASEAPKGTGDGHTDPPGLSWVPLRQNRPQTTRQEPPRCPPALVVEPRSSEGLSHQEGGRGEDTVAQQPGTPLREPQPGAHSFHRGWGLRVKGGTRHQRRAHRKEPHAAVRPPARHPRPPAPDGTPAHLVRAEHTLHEGSWGVTPARNKRRGSASSPVCPPRGGHLCSPPAGPVCPPWGGRLCSPPAGPTPSPPPLRPLRASVCSPTKRVRADRPPRSQSSSFLILDTVKGRGHSQPTVR